MNELLKVPDSAIIKDLQKIVSKKDIEIGKLKAYIQELEYKLNNLPQVNSIKTVKKTNKRLQDEVRYLKREPLNYTKAFEKTIK
jgi:ribosomal protein S8